jgi:hypothetical protein
MPKSRLLCLAGLALIGVLACQPAERGGVVSDSTFIAAMAALRRIGADTLMDSTARDSARKVVLRRYRLTPERLEQAARALADDPDHALAVWRAIEERQRGKRPLTAP